jgi:hypothetical protein
LVIVNKSELGIILCDIQHIYPTGVQDNRIQL